MSQIVLPGRSRELDEIVFDSNRDGNRLQLAIVEVGCMPDGKRTQVADKRITLKDYFRKNYRDSFPVLGGVAHYDTDRDISISLKSGKIDFLIQVIGLPFEIIFTLSEEDRTELLAKIGKEHEDSAMPKVVELLEANDNEGLYRLIREEGQSNHYANFRGTLAELLIERAINAGIRRVSRQGKDEVRYIPTYCIEGAKIPKDRHTETDGLLAFYNRQKVRELLDFLKSYYERFMVVNYNGAFTKKSSPKTSQG